MMEQEGKMTKEELLEKLRNPTGDTERDHAAADRWLLEYINDPEITAAFEALDKWYA
jgi:hypothetical protein